MYLSRCIGVYNLGMSASPVVNMPKRVLRTGGWELNTIEVTAATAR